MDNVASVHSSAETPQHMKDSKHSWTAESKLRNAALCALCGTTRDARGKNEFPERRAMTEQQESHLGVWELSQSAQKFGSLCHLVLRVVVAELLATHGAA